MEVERMEQSAPRVVQADRSQLELRAFDLDSIIPQDHRARLLWRAVETLELSAFYGGIKSREGTAGRPPGDPQVFVALWLYATMDGVGSARELERLCKEHRAYRWLCGGVAANHHTLSDFRVEHGPALDELLTQTLAVLMERQLVEVKRVAQDGLRVRASAGSGSFRRKRKLRYYLKEARAQVEAVKQLATGGALSARQRPARERAAREREQRVKEALAALQEIESKRQVEYTGGERKAKGEPRGAPTSERANADLRTYRTMDRMLARGAAKVLCVVLWNALALNLMRWFALAAIS
jgi:transposase